MVKRDERMNKNDSWNFETWACLPDIEKIEYFIRYRGFIPIQGSKTNDLFVHNNIVISIRKLRVNTGNKESYKGDK